ncbi:hypothetical protein LZ30DRAFT_50022 [Colletotrichum cereale]|nr:hypothetical protein LZ30DRAFT_50022 [Colletotrichum cereale]
MPAVLSWLLSPAQTGQRAQSHGPGRWTSNLSLPLTISHLLRVPDVSLSTLSRLNPHRPNVTQLVCTSNATRRADAQAATSEQTMSVKFHPLPRFFRWPTAPPSSSRRAASWSTSTSSVGYARCAGDTSRSVRHVRIQSDGRRLQTSSLPCPSSRPLPGPPRLA